MLFRKFANLIGSPTGFYLLPDRARSRERSNFILMVLDCNPPGFLQKQLPYCYLFLQELLNFAKMCGHISRCGHKQDNSKLKGTTFRKNSQNNDLY